MPTLRLVFLVFLFLFPSQYIFGEPFETNSIISEKYKELMDSNSSGLDLKQELGGLLKETHRRQYHYSEIWRVLKITDREPEGDEVVLIYGFDKAIVGEIFDDYTRDIDRNGGGQSDWNREHVFAKSLGGFGTSGPGADAHHLRASDVRFNGMRGSRRFIEGRGDAGPVGDGWYPGDEWRGDVARMVLYMYLRYDKQCAPNKVGMDRRFSKIDKNVPVIFLEWNREDQPSTIEFQRNEFLGDLASGGQGDRNPFIDHPEWVDKIWN